MRDGFPFYIVRAGCNNWHISNRNQLHYIMSVKYIVGLYVTISAWSASSKKFSIFEFNHLIFQKSGVHLRQQNVKLNSLG